MFFLLLACVYGGHAQTAEKSQPLNPNNVSFRVDETSGNLTKIVFLYKICEGEQKESRKFDPKTGTIIFTGPTNFRIDSILDTILVTSKVMSMLYEDEIINAYLAGGKLIAWSRPMNNREKHEHWSGIFYTQEQLFAAGSIQYDPNINFVVLKCELVKTTRTGKNNDTILWLISVILLPFIIWLATKLEDYKEEDVRRSIMSRAKNKIVRLFLIGLFWTWQLVSRLLIIVGMVIMICAIFGIFSLTLSLNPIFGVYICITVIFFVIDDKIKGKKNKSQK